MEMREQTEKIDLSEVEKSLDSLGKRIIYLHEILCFFLKPTEFYKESQLSELNSSPRMPINSPYVSRLIEIRSKIHEMSIEVEDMIENLDLGSEGIL